ncbi:MAG: tetratricopeptide repeat protein [Planctomycetota bacterium]|jgi:tetratricopeptide (TPR) repeat protein
MRRDTTKRGLLYGGAVSLAAVLLFLGFGITVAPDIGTRLSGAAMLAGVGSHDEALAEVELAIKEHPEVLDGYVYRAAILAQAERLPAALAAYDRALEHPDATGLMERSLRQDRASVLLAMDRTAEFKKARDQLAAGGTDRFVHSLDGLAASRRKDWAAAVGHWENAFKAEENPGSRSQLYAALVERGKQQVAEGRFEDATKQFDRARQLMPAVNEPFLRAAEARLAENDAEGALTAIAGCRDGTPGVAPLRVRAATMLLEAGKTDAAWNALESAFRCDKVAAAALVDAEPAWKDLGDPKRLAGLRGAE